MKPETRSAIPSGEWRIDGHQPGLDSAFGVAQAMADAMPERRFGLPSASAIDWSETSRRGLSRRALDLAMLFVEENLEDDFSLSDLAKAVGQSRSHFCRRFRLSTGETPMGYVRRRRILRAKSMLLEGKRKTSDIASALGFFDQSHFTRTFRRFTGLAPGEYVRMCEVAEVAF